MIRTFIRAIRGRLRGRRALTVVAATIAALIFGLSGGGAYAYFTSTGTGTGTASTGSEIAVTVTATSGTADLLPGGNGAVYFTLTNTNHLGATFNQVASGASVVSNNTVACPTADVSIAQTLPYTFSPAVTVGGSTTSGTQSIANLVQLTSSAPSTCQGVTFTVTMTLSGQTT